MKHKTVRKTTLDLFCFSPYFHEILTETGMVLRNKSDSRRICFSGDTILITILCERLRVGVLEPELKRLLSKLFGDKSEDVFECLVLEGAIE